MKKILYHNLFAVLAICCMIMTSCEKYLDIQPKGKQLLITVDDFDQWLNSTDIEQSLPRELNLLADNVDNVRLTNPPSNTVATTVYLWYDQFDQNVNSKPVFWSQHYKNIYYYNTVILGIDAASGGTANQKASLKAEAFLGRALEYLYLVNEYGKPYNSVTSKSDLAVPFVVSNDVNTPTPQRSTVQQIYDQIIADLNLAIPNLPSINTQNRFRGSIAAGYSILARTYLYMRNYEQAGKFAQLALSNGPNTIVDYNISTDASAIGLPILRPDAIYARIVSVLGSTEIPTTSFLKMFNKNDLRLQIWYTNLGNFTFPTRGKTAYFPAGVASVQIYPNWGTSVAEMRLIIAEAAVRNNDLTTALLQLDLVRKCRIQKSNYVAYASNNQENVLQAILNERVFEMPFNGTRWFDMRRLNSEGRMQTINRLNGNTATGAIVATLAPESPRYTLQIPLQVIYYNPDWTQNP